MSATLVIRFGALGDLCITSWFLAGYADTHPDSTLTLVTKPVFAELAREIPGVDRVHVLPASGPGGLIQLAATLRKLEIDHWLDAHSVLRSRLLSMLCFRRPNARLQKSTLDRLRLIQDKSTLQNHSAGEHLTLLDRCDNLVAGTPGRDRLTAPVRPPLSHLRPAQQGNRRLAIAPGARWPTKRWPLDHVAAMARTWLTYEHNSLLVVLGPDEKNWLEQPATLEIATHPRVEIMNGSSLIDAATALAGCEAVVTNDSGLLHLSEAVGTPVVALFGPTVRAFGYAPLLPNSRLLELDLECRPCSRTGSRPCHRGDLACLEAITPDSVLQAVNNILAPDAEAGP